MKNTTAYDKFNQSFLAKLGVEKPLIQAPMAGVQGSKLVIAVCQAGGLGSLPCAMLTNEQIEQEITEIRANTDRAFNVNFFAHQQNEYTAVMQQTWFAAMQGYYEEFGLSEQDIATTGGRQPFSQTTAELIADLKVPVVSFHFGLPSAELLTMIKKSGAKVLSSATTVAEAKWLQASGADAIIAQGLEAGGHRGMFLSQDLTTQAGTISLLPSIIRAVTVPVIGAGGIADKSTADATLVLGATAVQVGTALLLAEECDTKAFHRQALQSEQAYHTALTNIFSGGYARGIVNRVMQDTLRFEGNTTTGLSRFAPPFPHASFVTNPLKAKAEAMDITDFSSLWAGQNAPLATPGTAQAIIERIVG